MDILSALPFEAACDVLACGVLSPADVASVARVSKAWYAVALSEPTWYRMAKRSGLLPPPSAPAQGPAACVHEHDETGAFASVTSWRSLVSLRHALARQWGTGLARQARAPVPLPAVRHVVSLYGPQASEPATSGPPHDLVAMFRENIARNRLQRRLIPLPRHQALLVPGVQGDAWVVDTLSQELLWGAPPPSPPAQLDEDTIAAAADQPPAAPIAASVDSNGDQFILTAHVWGLDTCQVDVFRAHPAPDARGHFVHAGDLPMPEGLEHGYRNMLKTHDTSAAILAGGRTFVEWDLETFECIDAVIIADALPHNAGTIMPRSLDYDDNYIYLSATLLPNGAQGWPPATWDDLFVIRRPLKDGEHAKLVWSLSEATASGSPFGADATVWTAVFDPSLSLREKASEAHIVPGPQLGRMTPVDTVFARDPAADAILVATGRGVLIIRGSSTLFGQNDTKETAEEENGAAPTSTPVPTLVAMLDFGTDDESGGVPAYWPGSGHAQLSLCQGRGLYVSPTGRTLLVDYQNAMHPREIRVLDMSEAKRPVGQQNTTSVPFAPISALPPPSVPTPAPMTPAPSGRTTAPPTPAPMPAALASLAMTQRRPSMQALSRRPSFASVSRRPSFASVSRRPSRATSRRPSGLAPAPLTALRAMAAEQVKHEVGPKEKVHKFTPLPDAEGQAAATALSLSLYRAAQDRMFQRLYGVLPGRPCAAVALTPSAAYLLSMRVDGHPARHAVVQVWDMASSALLAVDPPAAAHAFSARTVLSPMDVDALPLPISRPGVALGTAVHQTAPAAQTPVAAQGQGRLPGHETPILLGA